MEPESKQMLVKFDLLRRDTAVTYTIIAFNQDDGREVTFLCSSKNHHAPRWAEIKPGDTLEVHYHVTEGGNYVLDSAEKIETEE